MNYKYQKIIAYLVILGCLVGAGFSIKNIISSKKTETIGGEQKQVLDKGKFGLNFGIMFGCISVAYIIFATIRQIDKEE